MSRVVVPEAIRSAEEGMRLLLDLLGPRQDLPDGFWEEGFVLGFLFFMFNALAIQDGASEEDLKSLDIGYGLLLRERSEAVTMRTLEMRDHKNSDFWRGLEAADRFDAITQGREEQPDPQLAAAIWGRAAEDVKLDLESGEGDLLLEQAIFIHAYDACFAAELRRRFPEHSGMQ